MVGLLTRDGLASYPPAGGRVSEKRLRRRAVHEVAKWRRDTVSLVHRIERLVHGFGRSGLTKNLLFVQRNRHTDSVVPNLVFTIADNFRIEPIGPTDDRLPSEFDLLGLAAWFDLVADLLRRHAERLSGSQLGAHTIDNFATASQTAGIRSRLTRTAGG